MILRAVAGVAALGCAAVAGAAPVTIHAGRLIAVGSPDELKARVGGTFVEVTVAAPSEVAAAAAATLSVSRPADGRQL